VRLVLDTDAVVAALRSPTGASAAVLRAIRQGRGVLLLSAALLIEYAATCQLAEHRRETGLSAGEVEAFLDGLGFLAEPVEVHYRWRPRLRDAGNEMVLEVAVNGGAHALVTFHRRDYEEVPETLGVEVLRPADALRRMRG
jgi:putative PIN family toxin of toxin-antitoxin system